MNRLFCVLTSKDNNFEIIKLAFEQSGYRNVQYENLGYGCSEITGCNSEEMHHAVFYNGSKTEEMDLLIGKYSDQIRGMADDKYFFFWRGPFSQWIPSKFTINNIKYSHAEQYMMHQKALLFGDNLTAKKILEATDPKEQKRLGRQVKGYDEKIWRENRERIVYDGNYAKFTQNKQSYNKLMNTGNKLLVEASPVDRIWGIGLAEDNPLAKDENTWQGLNLLGKILTKLREDLKKEKNND